MTPAELRELSDAELVERLGQLRKDLFNLRFALITGQLDNPQRLKQTRHDIARVLTLQKQRELAANAEVAT